MASTEQSDSANGAAPYSLPFFLRFVYDWWVLGISSTYLWRASVPEVQLPFFKERISSNHLEIGVGTGYYLARANLPRDARVTLCDLSPDSLAMAESRIPHLKSRILQHDILKPLPTEEKYGSISLMYVLHCLPGPPERKAAIFGHLKRNLQQDGVLFGSTVLGKGVVHNWFGRQLLKSYNRTGAFDNVNDSAEIFLKELKRHFEDVNATVEGRIFLFTARQPIQN